MIKKFIWFMIPKKIQKCIQNLHKQASIFKTLAQNYGQWKTIRSSSSVDKNGLPIPWYTYPTIEFLSHLDFSSFRVFEYGSGNSTFWWAQRSKQVTSVESDEFFYKQIRRKLKRQNVEIHLEIDSQKYFTKATNDFEVFIVDGKYRGKCVKHIVNKFKKELKKKGGGGEWLA
jgi:hypothetical protein